MPASPGIVPETDQIFSNRIAAALAKFTSSALKPERNPPAPAAPLRTPGSTGAADRAGTATCFNEGAPMAYLGISLEGWIVASMICADAVDAIAIAARITAIEQIMRQPDLGNRRCSRRCPSPGS